MNSKATLPISIAAVIILLASGCSVFRATGHTVSAVGHGAGTAVEGVGEGAEGAVVGTGRAISDAATETERSLRK